MASSKRRMVSASRMAYLLTADLAMEEKNLKLYERLLNFSEASPRQKEMMKLMVCEKERIIQACKKRIKHLTSPRA